MILHNVSLGSHMRASNIFSLLKSKAGSDADDVIDALCQTATIIAYEEKIKNENPPPKYVNYGLHHYKKNKFLLIATPGYTSSYQNSAFIVDARQIPAKAYYSIEPKADGTYLFEDVKAKLPKQNGLIDEERYDFLSSRGKSFDDKSVQASK